MESKVIYIVDYICNERKRLQMSINVLLHKQTDTTVNISNWLMYYN